MDEYRVIYRLLSDDPDETGSFKMTAMFGWNLEAAGAIDFINEDTDAKYIVIRKQ